MISIIIPTYKEEAYIRDAIRQFKDLSIPHEIIVTDDNSMDETVPIAKELGVKVLETKVKRGTIAANRNAGARVANGEYLVFLDADSRIQNVNDVFYHALGRFGKNHELVAITGSFWVAPSDESFTDRIVYTIFNVIHRIKNNLIHVGEAPGKFQMIRRSAFNKVGGFNEDLVSREDADMFQRLNSIGKTFADKNIIIYHSGRRSRAIGWPKLLRTWLVDAFSVSMRGRSQSKEWVAYR